MQCNSIQCNAIHQWYYGGIYTDIDNSPREFNGTTIRPGDDAFFTVEKLGIASQYFFAASPGHPIMLLALHEAIQSLWNTYNVMVNNPAGHTGPQATKRAFISFQRAAGIETNGYVPAGIYRGGLNESSLLGYGSNGNDHGIDIDRNTNTNTNSSNTNQRTVTLVGDKSNSKGIVDRGGLGRAKSKYMEAHGMPHYSTLSRKKWDRTRRTSCRNHIVGQEERIRALNLTLPVPNTGLAKDYDYVDDGTHTHHWYPRYQVANYSLDGHFYEQGVGA